MTSGQPDLPHPPERSDEEVRLGRVARRQEKIYRQIKRDRAGDHKIPTWALAVVLGALLAGWLYLIISS